ncbi:MAG: extracellular solute-binding protein [Candidatus Zixiibacteriota bacterium]
MKAFRTFHILILLVLLSCGKKEEDFVNLSWWQFWTNPEVKPTIVKLIKQFEKENPNIKVNLTDLTWSDGHEKIVVAFASGTAPDVLELGSDWVPEFSYQDVLLDVTSEAEKIKKEFLMWKPATIEERAFGFPWILDTRVLFYNKDLMKKAGLDPEKPPTTWDELIHCCEAISELKPEAYGFGANSAEPHRLYKKFLPFFWANGGKILSDDSRESEINKSEAVKALEFYKKLTQNGMMDTQAMLDEAFKHNKIGFVISGGWLLNDLRKNHPELSFGICLMPRPEPHRGTPASFAGGEFLVINKKTKNPFEALELIKFLIREDNCLKICQAIGSGFPSARGAGLNPYYRTDPYLTIFQEQLQYAISPPPHPKWVYIEEIIEKAVEEVMYDKKSPQDALDEAKSEIDKLLR